MGKLTIPHFLVLALVLSLLPGLSRSATAKPKLLDGTDQIADDDRRIINGPPRSGFFGWEVEILPNGNIVVVDITYDSPTITDVGAVYLYHGQTLELISVLTGDYPFDYVGRTGVEVLPNGDFVVRSSLWHNNTGAVTHCDKDVGCNGVVSPSNSLVGSLSGDQIGLDRFFILPNGNYVTVSRNWNSRRGAVTFGSAETRLTGLVSAANSLVGETPGDEIGSSGSPTTEGVSVLGNGKYVVSSSAWNSNRGTSTLCSGDVGCLGTVSANVSLTGNKSGDLVGRRGIIELGTGRYLVVSQNWDSDALTNVGAVTLVNSDSGLSGIVSSSNSLVGVIQSQNIGQSITVLENGNYVVFSRFGATFGDGHNGVVGETSIQNSLSADVSENDFYMGSVVALKNGNYVVVAPSWDSPTVSNVGAVTFCNGQTGTFGTVSPQNSFIGDGTNGAIGNGGVIPLSNGNYVISSPSWNTSRGAVTWADGTTGITGPISIENSLVGRNVLDRIGFEGIVPLPNGNYVVVSPDFDDTSVYDAGAVTLLSGSSPTSGELTAAISLVGSHQNDHVGYTGIHVLANGNFVVRSPQWNERRGAATFVNATSGLTGIVGPHNSLVGSYPNADEPVGNEIDPLPNGNYVVSVGYWNGKRGAVTFGNGSSGVTGEISVENSFVGSDPNDQVGNGNNSSGVIVLANGDFIIDSPNWNGDISALTYVSGTFGGNGVVSEINSLVGTQVLDSLGSGNSDGNGVKPGVVQFPDGNYLIYSPRYDNGSIVNAGAVTYGRHGQGLVGRLNSSNSIIGTTPDGGPAITQAYHAETRLLAVGFPLGKRVVLTTIGVPSTRYDFDGDGKADQAVYRAGSGEWFVYGSGTGFSTAVWGNETDKLVAADYDGDGKTDHAIFRDGTWWILKSTGGFMGPEWGTGTDTPVPADFDGDGKADLAIYREGTWWIYQSTAGPVTAQWGNPTDIPVPADYDGDGKADIAIFRDGTFWILKSTGGFMGAEWGTGTDKPVPADYDGDGTADLAIYREGTWWIYQSTAGAINYAWGNPSDVPIPADYDGDGKTDVAIFRDGDWWIYKSSGGFMGAPWGLATDVPIPRR